MNPGYATTTPARFRISFEEAAARIAAAGTFAELIATTGLGIDRRAASGARYVSARSAYRQLAKIVHPDAAGAARVESATLAFARLGALYAERDSGVVHPHRPAGRAQQHPSTGRRQTARDRVRTDPGPVPHPKPWSRFDRRFAAGDVTDLFAEGDQLLKVPRDPADSDLLAVEAAALRRLRSHGRAGFRAYAPRLMDTFVHVDGAGHRRTVNVVTRQRGFRDLAATGDLDPADLVWIWRRLLAGLGWAHRAGVVHGAVFEEHVLVDPRPRGLILIDWCYAAPAGGRPKALIARREPEYPPEVPVGRPVTPATDIYLATRLMTRLFGPDMPHPLRRFADGCLHPAPRMRPQDAWRLLAEFDELIPQRYRI
ncbi:molecular chaperone DnaJ [Actinoplanes teichomyceticus]|uniref:Protein kinase domain-containing protein n=1 Tax=Actinoplanes teichomyceticus TaxID=1867 RepID=A0A561VS43_ACTTI|nr:molecular chaperone DnaJ [Actinoplanes teichomyceticus]TWG14408.1 hypothetical protein FHX34_104708 [Actinoplanes teichomyceticus]GIF13030.1 hypothetical protein Ate01nite_30620 [Actinoplanes teichomyceticus]